MAYKPKRKSYRPYAKKGVSKATVKTLITKATDWSYYFTNTYDSAGLNNFLVYPLSNPNWTEAGKTNLKQLKLNVFRQDTGYVRYIVFQSKDTHEASNTTTPPPCAVDLLTGSAYYTTATHSQMYPDNKKYKILMDKLVFQGLDSTGMPVIQRTFNKLAPLTITNSAYDPEGHIYLLIIGGINGAMHISSTLKYSS